jgi:hypothetical protein
MKVIIELHVTRPESQVLLRVTRHVISHEPSIKCEGLFTQENPRTLQKKSEKSEKIQKNLKILLRIQICKNQKKIPQIRTFFLQKSKKKLQRFF